MTSTCIRTILLVATIILSFATHAYYTYAEVKLLKRYTILETLINIFDGFVFIAASFLMSDLFGPGLDSSFLWWLIYFTIGLVLFTCFTTLMEKICKSIWPKTESNLGYTTIKTPIGANIFGRVLVLLATIGLIIFFIYGSFTKEISGVGSIICVVLLILLFVIGGFQSIKEIIRLLKKK